MSTITTNVKIIDDEIILPESGGKRLRNLGAPSTGTDAVNADYVASTTIRWDQLEDVGATLFEPAGFPSRTASAITNPAGRTIRLAPTGASFDYWIAGSKYTRSALAEVTIPDVTGPYFVLIDDAGALSYTQDHEVIEAAIRGQEYAPVASVYWNADDARFELIGEERHWAMPGATHVWAHLVISAQWVRDPGGLALGSFTIGNGSAGSHAQFGIVAGRIADEDLIHEFSTSSPLTVPVLYRYGAAGTWRSKTADAYPIIQSGAAGYTGASGRIAYNRYDEGTWSLAEAPANSYVIVLVFATNDIAVGAGLVSILGQDTYGTLTAARDAVPGALAALSGLPSLFAAELVPIGAVIYQTSAGYANAVKARVVEVESGLPYYDLRGARFGGAAAAGAYQTTLAQMLSLDTSAGGSKITDLADPTESTDAATRAYVDQNRGVFSTTPPLGASAPVAVFDFTRADPTLAASVNTAAVNIAGPALSITSGGTVAYEYAAAHVMADNGTYPRPPAGQSTASTGTALVTDGTVGNSVESAAGTALAITGALTVEWVGAFDAVAAGTVSLFEYAGAGTDDEVENFLYRLAFDGTSGKWTYFAESGGVANNNISADLTGVLGTPADENFHVYALARNASGHVRLYIDGYPLTGWVVPTHQSGGSLVPSGGGNAKLKINGTVDGACLGVRVFDTLLTGAQLQESARFTLYGQ